MLKATYNEETKRVDLESDSPFRDSDRLKSIAGSRFDTHRRIWTIAPTYAAWIHLTAMFQNTIMCEKYQSIINNIYDTKIKPCKEIREAIDAEGDERLYPFQRAGVKFLSLANKAILADEMGSGKTVQAIVTLKELSSKNTVLPIVVIAPASMLKTWQREFRTWWPEVRAEVIQGTASQRLKLLTTQPDVYIINYESLKAHTKLGSYGSVALKSCILCDDFSSGKPSSCQRCPKEFNKFSIKSIIVDEAHRMKDPRSQQSRAVWALRTEDTENVFALSGTLVANAPHDLWPVLHLIDPESFPVRSKFIDRYTDSYVNFFGGLEVLGLDQSNKAEFFALLDPIMRRMPKSVTLRDLPPKQYSTRYLQMGTTQAKLYKSMEENMIAMLSEESDAVIATSPLTQLIRLSQFASASADVLENEVILKAPSNKIDALIELLDDTGDEPIVVFAESRKLIMLAAQQLEKKKISHSLVVGDQTQYDRTQAIDDFQEGRCRVILCTIGAGSVGITLTRANRLVFLQRSWSNIQNKQAEDRVHRIGSEVHESVEIIDFVSEGTVEERQRDALDTKAERLEEVMRDKNFLRSLFGVVPD